MLNKIHREIDDFTSDIKTIKNHEELLNYMNSNFYASIKLLIAISSRFSIYWKVVLPFIVSLSALFVLLNIEPIAKEVDGVLNISYVFAILFALVSFKLLYILHCRKYLVSCIQMSKSVMEKVTQAKEKAVLDV